MTIRRKEGQQVPTLAGVGFDASDVVGFGVVEGVHEVGELLLELLCEGAAAVVAAALGEQLLDQLAARTLQQRLQVLKQAVRVLLQEVLCAACAGEATNTWVRTGIHQDQLVRTLTS